MENLPGTPAPTPEPESTRSLSGMPSFKEHMASRGQARITPEAKERILQAAVYRDEASRRRLDFAAEKGLSVDEQDRILDKEIAIEDADKKLIEDLASDDGTVASMEEKLKDSINAVNEADGDVAHINLPEGSVMAGGSYGGVYKRKWSR